MPPGQSGIPLPPAITIEGLHKSFGRLEVLKGIDVAVDRGEVICVIGPSGSPSPGPSACSPRSVSYTHLTLPT